MMTDRIRALEALARPLEPSSAERGTLTGAVFDYGDAFVGGLGDRPVFVGDDTSAALLDAPITDEPAAIGDLLALLGAHVDAPGLNPASAGHLGYIPGGGLVHAALGDYLAALTNRYAGVFFASPGAVRMENMLIDWMASLVGYPSNAVGNLTSGGSIATLIAVVSARDARGITARTVERAVVYATTHVHHSLGKALRIAGLGECVVRHVPMDDRYRMDAAALDRLVADDARAGLRPWLVVASAGTTDVGAIDPMAAIGDIAERHGLWFHLDAAYGGFFALCDAGRAVLGGMERSDSLVMDPHKGLFLPYGSGAVLIKDRQAALEAHQSTAHYMQDAVQRRDELSPADLSPELSKHFRGLRMWLPLKICGLAPFRAALEEKMLLARYFREQLLRIPGFEVGPVPDLSVVTFRYLPAEGDPDVFNERLVQAIHRDGRVFLSSSRVDGTFIIRLAVLSFRTHLETIDLALDVIRELVATGAQDGTNPDRRA